MDEKDPKDMTAAELLRWAANGELDEYGLSNVHSKLLSALGGRSFADTTTREDRESIRALADKIDAEIEAARKAAVKESKKPMWWFRSAIRQGEDWPAPRDGEKFRDYLSRCFIPRPRFDDEEPVQFGDEAIVCDDIGEVYKMVFGENGCDEVVIGFEYDSSATHYMCVDGNRVKRHAPKALGADGLPVVEGETVYLSADGTEGTVKSVNRDNATAYIEYSDHRWSPLVSCSALTHILPDTQKRIDGVRGGGNCGTTTYRLSCGHAAVMPEGTRFGYCPDCGAKVAPC